MASFSAFSLRVCSALSVAFVGAFRVRVVFGAAGVFRTNVGFGAVAGVFRTRFVFVFDSGAGAPAPVLPFTNFCQFQDSNSSLSLSSSKAFTASEFISSARSYRSSTSKVFAYSACTSASRELVSPASAAFPSLVITAHAITAAHATRAPSHASTPSSRAFKTSSSVSPSRLSPWRPARPETVFARNSRPARVVVVPPRTLTRRPHRSRTVARDDTTIIAISLPPRARVERRRVTRVSSLDRLDRSRVASYLLTDSGSVLDGVSRAFSMDGWTCVCVSLPIGCVGRMDGWMRRVDGWMTPGARAFPRRVPSNARVVSSLLVTWFRVASRPLARHPSTR